MSACVWKEDTTKYMQQKTCNGGTTDDDHHHDITCFGLKEKKVK